MPQTNPLRPSEEQLNFQAWLKNEVTQKLFERLRFERETMVKWVIHNSVEDTDAVRGRILAIDHLLEMTWEDLYEPT